MPQKTLRLLDILVVADVVFVGGPDVRLTRSQEGRVKLIGGGVLDCDEIVSAAVIVARNYFQCFQFPIDISAS